MKPLFIGIDPGLRCTGWAELSETELVLMAIEHDEGSMENRAQVMQGIMQIRLDFALESGRPVVLAVEWQQERGQNDRAPADDIINLCGFAGIAAGTVMTRASLVYDVYLPRPVDWKGSVPKHLHQNRIVAQAGLERVTEALQGHQCPVPRDLGNFTRPFSGKAKEPIDALGLAMWAQNRYRLEERYSA